MSRRRATSDEETLRLKLELAELREQNNKLEHVNSLLMENLKEHSKLFQRLKPTRLALSSERKLYIAGSQYFKCAAPHGKEKCPCWLLHEGSFDEAGFEIDHDLPYSVGYRNAGTCSALCYSCHGLKSRLERMKAAGKEEEDEE